MKTDKKKLLSEVKACLDYASWNYYYSSNKDIDDTEKACDYLGTQRFSIKKIEELIDKYKEDITFNLKSTHVEDEFTYVASFIADQLAQDKIKRFVISKKWYIDGGVTFTIN